MRGCLFILATFFVVGSYAQLGPTGPNDTIPVAVYKNGMDTDSFPLHWDENVVVQARLTPEAKKKIEERERLQRWVADLYPMAIKAADKVNEIRLQKTAIEKRKDKKKFVKSVEKELKEEFLEKIKNMYIGRGKVLVKLINRETGSTCYDIIKEMKSGANARLWQTVISLYDGDLKATYDPEGEDYQLEIIVKQYAKLYGRK
jgi:hypothetical protein